VHGFLIGVELENDTDINAVMRAIGEALYTFMGVGTVDLEHLGKIDVIDEVGVRVEMEPEQLSLGPMKES